MWYKGLYLQVGESGEDPLRANFSGHLKAFVVVAGLQFVTGAMLQAQVTFRTNTPEIGGFVGGSYGVDKTRVMGGGNFVYSLTSVIMPFAEFSYFPGIGRDYPISGLPAGSKATYSLPITDFNAGLHVRWPIPKSHVIPYGVISAGEIHNSSYNATINVTGPSPTTFNYPIPSATHFTGSFGGGIRVYATEKIGFRGEAKFYKSTETGQATFYRITAGIFYQF